MTMTFLSNCMFPKVESTLMTDYDLKQMQKIKWNANSSVESFISMLTECRVITCIIMKLLVHIFPKALNQCNINSSNAFNFRNTLVGFRTRERQADVEFRLPSCLMSWAILSFNEGVVSVSSSWSTVYQTSTIKS